jgi:signal transduction histidine kinase
VIVETVAEALKLPYVAIELKADDKFIRAASAGEPVDKSLMLPLLYQSETLGQLVLGRRSSEVDFSVADQTLLGDLARQASAAAYASHLMADLQRSRERLVTAREEERRRLRRDLHDGLGPELATMAMQSEAARDLLTSDPVQANALLSDLTEQLQAATADIRRLIHELRPPALDDLGLLGALRNQIIQFERSGVQIVLDAPNTLPALPAATEVAAYRITVEALNNVVRHAEARGCRVEIASDAASGHLRIAISDDGRGMPNGRQAGVGLASMRERAAELGGVCAIERAEAGGTRVHMLLPLGSTP